MTTSTQNLGTAEAILDEVNSRRVRQQGAFDANAAGETAAIQLAGSYIGLAAIKVTIETQEVLRASMERENY